jgi:hypothetical protein
VDFRSDSSPNNIPQVSALPVFFNKNVKRFVTSICHRCFFLDGNSQLRYLDNNEKVIDSSSKK